MAKKAAALAGTVTASLASTARYDGEVEVMDSGAVKVKFKKPRSSKYQTSIFPASQILVSSVGEEGGYVTVRAVESFVEESVDDVNSVEITETTVSFTNSDGEEIVINLLPGVRYLERSSLI
jgi:hypothetical protein